MFVLRFLLPVFVLAASSVASPPELRSASPDLGDTGVDPTLSELRLEFDQDMDTRGGMSICGGGPEFPKITGKARWKSARVVLVPVALEPSHTYRLSINCPAASNFRSAAGEPAAITALAFSTAAGKDAARPAAPTPEENARAIASLQRALAERYSHRDVRLVDWDAAIGARAGELAAAGSRGRFARVAARILGAARDVHLTLRVGETRIGTFSPMQAPNCNATVLERLVPGFQRRNNTVATGAYEDGMAYVLITSWPGDAGAIRPALDFLGEHLDSPGVIIDVRANDGGDELTARRFAACFVEKSVVYSKNRYRDPAGADGWGPVLERRIEPATDGPRYLGRVAVLMGPCCMSSNESFLLMMRTCPRATLIGEPSYGASGNPRPVELGNGVTVLLPSWQDLLPDGTPLEGRGVTPDIGVRLRPDEPESHDPVLDTALRALRHPSPAPRP